MIIIKGWVKFRTGHKDVYEGAFLFGFIPIYIKRHRVY